MPRVPGGAGSRGAEAVRESVAPLDLTPGLLSRAFSMRVEAETLNPSSSPAARVRLLGVFLGRRRAGGGVREPPTSV